MRYSILFFYLLFGQITPIQANYSAPQVANYQGIATYKKPVEPKKTKPHTKPQGEIFFKFFLGIFFLVGLGLVFLLGLELFVSSLLAINNLFWIGLIIELVSLAGMIGVLLWLGAGKRWAIIGIVIISSIFLLIKSILFLILGIALSISWVWIIALLVLLATIIFLFYFYYNF